MAVITSALSSMYTVADITNPWAWKDDGHTCGTGKELMLWYVELRNGKRTNREAYRRVTVEG